MNGLSYLIILHDQEAGRTHKNVVSLNFVWAWNSSPRSMYPRCRCSDSLIYIILAYIKNKKIILKQRKHIFLSQHLINYIPKK